MQELQTFGDLTQDAACHKLPALVQFDLLRCLEGTPYRHSGEVGDADAIYAHCQTFLPEAFAVAERACGRRHILQQPLAITLRSRFFQVAF